MKLHQVDRIQGDVGVRISNFKDDSVAARYEWLPDSWIVRIDRGRSFRV